ncbi:MAG: DNA repair exonuclease [Nanoarchaeota archaeon]
MKFAHIGDCHLGGWRQPQLRDLNFKSFQEAVRRIIKNKLEFVLISGDLFDSAYPSIETLKYSFNEFRKLKEQKIPVFLIAGSHDYSVSGKTFLDVLERAGFCKNVVNYTEREGKLLLEPTLHKNIAIYGFPGKKSGLEVDEVSRIKIQDSPGLFKILMLHTTIRDAVGETPIKAVDERLLPKVDYLALSHLHIRYNKEGRVYSGPTFPNNLSELEELKGGSFCIFENGRIRREEIIIKEVLLIEIKITNVFTAAEEILKIISDKEVKDKIIIAKLTGTLDKGKISDIDFQKIESYLSEKGAFVFLKGTSKLHMVEPEVKLDALDSENLEEQIIRRFEERNPSRFNSLIPDLMKILTVEKLEDETASSFEERLLSESKKVLKYEI